MEEEKSDEDEEVIIGKNIIHNNFENADFLKNFRYPYENIHHFYQSYECSYPYVINRKFTIEEDELKNSLFLKNERINKYKTAAKVEQKSESLQRCQIDERRGKHRKVKKFIIHLVPSKNSEFYNFLKKKKEQVLRKYGKDETYKYDFHISLTGYFFCDNINAFIKSLYMYMFYYVKLYHVSKKLSDRNLFFYIPFKSGQEQHDSCYSQYIENGPSNYMREKFLNKRCDMLLGKTWRKRWKEQLKEQLENQLEKQPMELKPPYVKPHNQRTYKIDANRQEGGKRNTTEKNILTTNDGYVIIPILCEWLKRIFENFRFLIKNNNFTSCKRHRHVHKHSFVMNGQNSKWNVSKDRDLNVYLCVMDSSLRGGNYPVGNLAGAEAGVEAEAEAGAETEAEAGAEAEAEAGADAVEGANHRDAMIGVGAHLVPCQRNFTSMEEEKHYEEPIDRIHLCDKNVKNINGSKRKRYSVSSVSTCTSSKDDSGSFYENVEIIKNWSDTKKEKINCAEVKNIAKYEKKTLNYKKAKIIQSKCSKTKMVIKEREDGKNKIKYRYNNAKVNLFEFRIKNCNHISLASNRKDQDIQKDIAYMYKDMKHYFSNCTWDLVLFESMDKEIQCNNTDMTHKDENPILNEIFRFSNFANS
ncbi:hypothetical protein, conserved [Plasmodium gonderi]|uniref:Uncharacterized protein n=1 Tax=Plasmodium gonderi TaxID=77519 RepID=A0A1Y1JBJ5_PLAGO|nr:hypothetical protein, conserved [Plasmodium gonderi]GAW79889.1 hypothetical protein, conserved [Plasmodium gonderi]